MKLLLPLTKEVALLKINSNYAARRLKQTKTNQQIGDLSMVLVKSYSVLETNKLINTIAIIVVCNAKKRLTQAVRLS